MHERTRRVPQRPFSAERGIHGLTQLTDYTGFFVESEFPYHQKCQRIRELTGAPSPERMRAGADYYHVMI